MTKVGLYAIDKSTTLESNKSLARLRWCFWGSKGAVEAQAGSSAHPTWTMR